MLIRDAVDDFVLGLKTSRASPSTVRQYEAMLHRVAKFAARQNRDRLDELTLAVARAAIADTYKKHRASPSNWKGGEATAYAMVNALRAFSVALRADGISIADFTAVRLPNVPQRIQPRLDPDEFRKLEAAVLSRLMRGRAHRYEVARDLALLSFMADTGLRAAEICRLNVEDLDLTSGTVSVWGKGDKPRVLSIRDDDPAENDGGPTIRALQDYLAYRTSTFGANTRERALWLSRGSTRMSYTVLYRNLANLCDAAGIERRPPHAFRRGYFSAEYRERPTALPILRQRMGWSPKSHHMVEVYTRGADIDLARDQPQPSVAKRWREAGAKDRRQTRTAVPRQHAPAVPASTIQAAPDIAALLASALREDPELLRSAIAMALRPEDGTAESGVA